MDGTKNRGGTDTGQVENGDDGRGAMKKNDDYDDNVPSGVARPTTGDRRIGFNNGSLVTVELGI